MIADVSFGNAADDGKEFRQWFIGDLVRWSGLAPGPARDRFGARQASTVSVKWGVHPAGEERPGGWTDGDDSMTMSALVSGVFVLSFEAPGGEPLQVRLHRPGDYAVWSPRTRHTWRAESASVILTVRWRELANEMPSSR